MLTDNPQYWAYADSIRELHLLAQRGLFESDEAEMVRDRSDEHWTFLTKREMDWLRCLSSDLYTLEGENPQIGGRVPDVSISEEIWEAVREDRFDDVVQLTSRLDDPAYAAFTRAAYWSFLGDTSSALLLIDEAIRLDPEDQYHQIMRTQIRSFLDRSQAFREAEELTKQPVDREPNLRLVLEVIVFLLALTQSRSDALKESVEKIQEILNHPERSLSLRPDFREVALWILDLYHRWLANHDDPILLKMAGDALNELPTTMHQYIPQSAA